MADKKLDEGTSIPVGKIKRAASFAAAGARVGGNYLKYMADRAKGDISAKERLHERNASDLYKSLSKLKGSALKVAQILSMDNAVLPEAYTTQFAQAQYSAPPLSYPLVERTFEKQLGKKPTELFDSFTTKAVHAASIGQVHKAELNGKTLAVKVQYPGVAEAIQSDLKMVKPVATAMFQLNDAEINYYMGEVEEKLLEETNYELELAQACEIGDAVSKEIDNLLFPKYYPEYSGPRILTMDWIEGKHINEFLKTNPSQETKNNMGQLLWDFYNFQMHILKKVHADPHPGNFLFTEDGKVGVLDFGCCKTIPEDFYESYFSLIDQKHLNSDEAFRRLLYNLNFIYEDDEHKEQYVAVYKTLLSLLARPFFEGTFDFGDKRYFDEIAAMGQELSKNPILRDSRKARGSRHALYINRSFFGLYNLLHMLGAEVETHSYFKPMPV